MCSSDLAAEASTWIGNPTLKVLPDGVGSLQVHAVRVLPCQAGAPVTIGAAPPGGNLVGVPLEVPGGHWCGVAVDLTLGEVAFPNRRAPFDPDLQDPGTQAIAVDVYVDREAFLDASIHL